MKGKKVEKINYKNKEGWEKYKEYSDSIAEDIITICNDESLSIDEVRAKIKAVEDAAHKECFGTTWVGPKKQKKLKIRSVADTKTLLKKTVCRAR